MALSFECMQTCASKVLDTADIVRDGDVSPIDQSELHHHDCDLWKMKKKTARVKQPNA